MGTDARHRAYAGVVLFTVGGTPIVYDVAADGSTMRVLLNLADAPLRHAVEGELLAGSADVSGGDAIVPPHGWAVIG